MVRQRGFAPSAIEKMPFWSARLVLRLVISHRQWQRIEPLLDASRAEHEQVARRDDGTLTRYSAITARVLLLGGRKSPPFITTELFDALQRNIPDSAAEILDGLDHTAPDEKDPEFVGERIRRYLGTRAEHFRGGGAQPIQPRRSHFRAMNLIRPSSLVLRTTRKGIKSGRP
jgi:hypothetical protein